MLMGAKLIRHLTESISRGLASHFIVDSVSMRACLYRWRWPTISSTDRCEFDPLGRVYNVAIINQVRIIGDYTRASRSLGLVPRVLHIRTLILITASRSLEALRLGRRVCLLAITSFTQGTWFGGGNFRFHLYILMAWGWTILLMLVNLSGNRSAPRSLWYMA